MSSPLLKRTPKVGLPTGGSHFKIVSKYVLYRGEDGELDNGIKYLDVSKFLLM